MLLRIVIDMILKARPRYRSIKIFALKGINVIKYYLQISIFNKFCNYD